MTEPEAMWFTPDQLVAYNLWRARQLRRLTQEEAADRLQPFLGVKWSKASFSVAERSFQGGRQRRFTAKEIMAFAQAFELPIDWFFLPPAPADGEFDYASKVPVVTRDVPKGRRPREQRPWDLLPGNLIDLLFGGDVGAFMDRLATTAVALPPNLQGQVQAAWAEYYARATGSIAGVNLGKFVRWSESLRELADALDRVMAETPSEVFRNLEREGVLPSPAAETLVITMPSDLDQDQPRAARKRRRRATPKGGK